MISKTTGILCFGCGRPVGAKGTPPAEVIRLAGGAELRIHRHHDCRTMAVRRYVSGERE